MTPATLDNPIRVIPSRILGGVLASASTIPMTSTLHDANYRAFVAHLTTLRLGLGVTQADLAQRLGKPQSFVFKTERFERRIDPEEFRAIAAALGADPAQEFTIVVDQLRRN